MDGRNHCYRTGSLISFSHFYFSIKELSTDRLYNVTNEVCFPWIKSPLSPSGSPWPHVAWGIGLPIGISKNARDRLNYFFYNIQSHSTLSTKFEMSIISTQIECGLFTQFFSTSFLTYGHLVFPSFCVQLWQELEPHGIILRPAENSHGILHHFVVAMRP